jgi:catechol 2,3-dioxygenase-like lactoylglutathione lyase family enzyme
MTLRPMSVAVAVTDRKEAARWYVEKLGLRLVDDDPEHWTTVGDRSRRFLLHLCEIGDRPGRSPPRSEVGNTGILFATNESMARTYARLRRRGVKFSLPPKRFPWGWVAKFLDPDGNEFWLNPET